MRRASITLLVLAAATIQAAPVALHDKRQIIEIIELPAQIQAQVIVIGGGQKPVIQQQTVRVVQQQTQQTVPVIQQQTTRVQGQILVPSVMNTKQTVVLNGGAPIQAGTITIPQVKNSGAPPTVLTNGKPVTETTGTTGTTEKTGQVVLPPKTNGDAPPKANGGTIETGTPINKPVEGGGKPAGTTGGAPPRNSPVPLGAPVQNPQATPVAGGINAPPAIYSQTAPTQAGNNKAAAQTGAPAGQPLPISLPNQAPVPGLAVNPNAPPRPLPNAAPIGQR
ncbi:hypothetical protein HDU98_003298 [Podochytrium sp. JEL0797]|nr:hypothetical protein HDU98_003298 [Podochytrium sp. JEL0797]